MASSSFALRVALVACALVGAAMADRDLLGKKSKNCTGLPPTLSAGTYGAPCDMLTAASSSPKGTFCPVVCTAPLVGSGGAECEKKGRWELEKKSGCFAIKIDLSLATKKPRINSTITFKASVFAGKTKVANETVVLQVQIAPSTFSTIDNKTTNAKGSVTFVEPTTSPPAVVGPNTVRAFVDLDGDGAFTSGEPFDVVTFTLKSGKSKKGR
jgi:hypothetical protein